MIPLSHRGFHRSIVQTLQHTYYRPQTKLQKGNAFTRVCQSFSSQGGCLSHTPPTPGHTHPGQTPSGQTPPWADTPRQIPLGQTPPHPVHTGIDMATAVDGTHPTGMHSCLYLMFCSWHWKNQQNNLIQEKSTFYAEFLVGKGIKRYDR